MNFRKCIALGAAALFAGAGSVSAAVSWSKDVFPILQKKCFGCHSDLSQKGGLNLERRDVILKGGSKLGGAVLPGNAEKSPLIRLISGKEEPRMPPKGKLLAEADVKVIAAWITEGAKFDAEGVFELDKPNWITLNSTVNVVNAVALSPDGKQVAFGRGATVEVWDVDATKRLVVLEGAKDLIQSLAFSPDGKMLAAGEFEQAVVYNTADWKPAKTLGGHLDRVTCAVFSKDGKLLVTASGLPVKSGFIHVWQISDGKELRRIEAHSDTIYGLSLDADAKTVGSASADKLAKLHEVETGKFIKQFAGHTHHVLGVAISPDGKQLVTGGADADVKLWDIAKGEQTKTSKGHSKQITGLVYRPDGKNFYTVAGDKTVREWNPAGNAAKSFAAMNDYVYCVAISGDGNRLAAGGHDGVVRVYATAAAPAIKEFTKATPAEPPAVPVEEPKTKKKK